MTSLASIRTGARLNPERDLQVCYCLGRFMAATSATLAPLFFGSPHTARRGFARLGKLGLIRSFPRALPNFPAWYALTRVGYEWVIQETGAAASELCRPIRLDRTNLGMLTARNELWVSLVLSARSLPAVRLALVRPERELRRMRESGVAVVPDMHVEVQRADGALARTWFIELDAGTERLRTWEEKAAAYLAATCRPLYGSERWRVLAVVPTLRRAQSVGQAVTKAGAGTFIYITVAETLTPGRAFAPVVYRALDLAGTKALPSATTLIEGLVPIEHDGAQQQIGVQRPEVLV